MSELAKKTCIPCSGGIPPLNADQIAELKPQLNQGWDVVENHHLERRFTFDDFQGALDFTNRTGELAEQEGHHPEICLTWGRADIRIWTHKIDGLTESDFILAAKIDALEQ